MGEIRLRGEGQKIKIMIMEMVEHQTGRRQLKTTRDSKDPLRNTESLTEAEDDKKKKKTR